MKKYRSLAGISVLSLILCRLGYESLTAYLGLHSYYESILSNWTNFWLIIASILCVIIFPIGYACISQKVKFKRFVFWLGIGSVFFGLIHSIIKLSGDDMHLGGPAPLITLFNNALLFALGVYLISGFLALGSWIQRKIVKFQQIRWQEICLSFGLGLIAFLVIVELLMGFDLLYCITSWILFLGLGFMIRYEGEQLDKWCDTFSELLKQVKSGILAGKLGYISVFVLSILSITYLYFGVQNSFVPYSTARDANHEYMYTPKIIAGNNGIMRGNSVGNTMPGFWHQFITFIFSLTGGTNGRFGLSSDNLAVSMNNISAWLVLLFGIAVIFQIFSFINQKRNLSHESNEDKGNKTIKTNKKIIEIKDLDNSLGITIGRFILILWLTSGMGAFLVIVDNKTDLGVMFLSLLALLAGLIFLQVNKETSNKKDISKYIIIAGLFFGFAAFAKITAFVDLALFGLFLIALYFSPILSLGIGVVLMGLLRKMNILTSSTMLTNNGATRFIIIGLIITFVGCLYYFIKKFDKKKFKTSLFSLIILGISFLLPLLLLKLPWTIFSQTRLGTFSFSSAIKSTLLAKSDKLDTNKLVAQATGIEEYNMSSLDNQNIVDESAVKNNSTDTFTQCSKIGNIYSESELNENLQEIIGDSASEDFGRYIGYGWQTFTGGESNNKNGMYRILKLLWPHNSSDGDISCYGFNHDAKVLCKNASVIDAFKIDDLRGIYDNEIDDKEGEAGLLLKDAIDAYDNAKSEGKIGFFIDTSIFHDEIVALQQYYKSHAIGSTSDSVSIPFRYLVPLNISFNRSLQNLSSYYTDLGYMRVVIYILLIISLPYALVKKERDLVNLSLTTLLGWGIWWIIGSAILWYGTVLISWTMITLAVFITRFFKKENNDYPKILLGVLYGIIIIIFGIQLLFNLYRIGSQGASSAWVRYKGNYGQEQIIDEDLNANTQPKMGYSQSDLFNLQFGQYNPIINALKNREDEDGVVVAGTYIQYFLDNQRNVKGDGMLNNFWLNASDGNLCKTYRRLRNDNTRYFIIDPNIGTVTMGEGNESLFYRFFGKLNSNETQIEIDGAIITLIRLAHNGYLKLLSTNNIGVKYAFTLDDDVLRDYFGSDLSDEELILKRSKMAVLQYFDDADELFSTVADIFMSRILGDPVDGLEDIASIYGLEIDSQKVAAVANSYFSNDLNGVKDLTQDERSALITYLNIYLAYNKDTTSAWNYIQNIAVNSVSGGSQIIALELN